MLNRVEKYLDKEVADNTKLLDTERDLIIDLSKDCFKKKGVFFSYELLYLNFDLSFFYSLRD